MRSAVLTMLLVVHLLSCTAFEESLRHSHEFIASTPAVEVAAPLWPAHTPHDEQAHPQCDMASAPVGPDPSPAAAGAPADTPSVVERFPAAVVDLPAPRLLPTSTTLCVWRV